MLKTIYLNIQNLLNFYLVSDFSFLINLIRHFQHKLMQKKLKIVLASIKRAPTSLFETFGHVLWWVFSFYSEKTTERRDRGRQDQGNDREWPEGQPAPAWTFQQVSHLS